MVSALAEKVRVKYRGKTADGYDDKRDVQEKRKAEIRVLRQIVASVPDGSRILDVPAGTGLLFPMYEGRGFRVDAVDSSQDMLDRAVVRVPRGSDVNLRTGDIFSLDYPDKTFDVAFCIRIFNLFETDDMKAALKEVQRVTKDRIIFNLRVWHPKTKYRRPRRIEDVESVLDGFKIVANQEIHEFDFRMIELAAI